MKKNSSKTNYSCKTNKCDNCNQNNSNMNRSNKNNKVKKDNSSRSFEIDHNDDHSFNLR